MIKNLLYPSKNIRLFVLMIPMTNVLLLMMPSKHYICNRTKDLYPIYLVDELTENTINLILKVQWIYFLITMLNTLLFALFLGIQCCEVSIVENYLPEFKGTYDEGQDELLASDWSGHQEAENAD